MVNFKRIGSIKLIDAGEFLFEGGKQTKSGFPLFEGVISVSPEQQVEIAVILKRKGEREFLRVGSIDFAFYFKESGRCNLVVKDLSTNKVSVFPINQLEQEELRELILYSLYKQTASLYIEGNVVLKESASSEIEMNGVLIPEEECYRLAKALEIGSYYECKINGVQQVAAGIRGYSISNYILSTDNSFKLQALFESASLFVKPTFLFIDRPVITG